MNINQSNFKYYKLLNKKQIKQIKKSMTPVLQPKRKQFGFLKPPASSTVKSNGIITIFNHVSNLTPIKEIQNNKKCFNLINYNFDTLPINSNGRNINEINKKSELVCTISNQRNVYLKTIANKQHNHQQLQFYPKIYDFNAQTKLREYKVLRLPIKLETKSVATSRINGNQLIQQLINDRRENTFVYETCRLCGKSGHENNKCFYYRENDIKNISWILNKIKKIDKNTNNTNHDFTSKSLYF